MVRLNIGGVEVCLSFWFFAMVAAFALVERGALAFYLLLPVAVHELGHLLVMAFCRVGIKGVRFTAFGVDIRRRGRTLSYGTELAVCLGGAAANLALALLLHLFCFHSMRLMLLVACNIAVALFNLAPIGDLDGGQVLGLLAARFFSPATARIISRATSFLLLGALFGLAIFLILIHNYNITLLGACGYLAAQVIFRE